MDKLKIIKIIVCLFTFLFVFGCLVLLGVIYQKTKAASADKAPYSEQSLELPLGSKILSANGTDKLLYILVNNPFTGNYIIVLNTKNWQKTATIGAF